MDYQNAAIEWSQALNYYPICIRHNKRPTDHRWCVAIKEGASWMARTETYRTRVLWVCDPRPCDNWKELTTKFTPFGFLYPSFLGMNLMVVVGILSFIALHWSAGRVQVDEIPITMLSGRRGRTFVPVFNVHLSRDSSNDLCYCSELVCGQRRRCIRWFIANRRRAE